MAGKIDASGGGSGLVAEINVIPFVDIVLVVLIIFMVTAPSMMSPALDIHLPKAETGSVDRTENIVLTMGLDGTIAINGEIVPKKSLEKQLAAIIKKKEGVRAIIAADKDVAYGRVIGIVDMVKKMGITKFAVTVDQE